MLFQLIRYALSFLFKVVRLAENAYKQMKEAHKKAIEAATEAGAIINFDPNLRFALWEHVTVYYSSIE